MNVGDHGNPGSATRLKPTRQKVKPGMTVAVDETLHKFWWSSHHHCSTPSHSWLSLLSGVVISLGLPLTTLTVPSRGLILQPAISSACPLHLADHTCDGRLQRDAFVPVLLSAVALHTAPATTTL